MGIDDDGELWMAKAPEFKWFNRQFNLEYRAFFKKCRFTAVAWCGDKFVAAGMEESEEVEDASGKCVVYSSESGGVFRRENLASVMQEGVFMPVKKVNCICYDEKTGQAYLAGDGGQIVTLNGSPHCTKVKYLANSEIEGVSITEGNDMARNFIIEYVDGGITLMNINDIVQTRIDMEIAREKLEHGALFIRVIESKEEEKGGEGVMALKFMYKEEPMIVLREELHSFLKDQDKDTVMLFADDRSALYARNCGYSQSYSVFS